MPWPIQTITWIAILFRSVLKCCWWHIFWESAQRGALVSWVYNACSFEGNTNNALYKSLLLSSVTQKMPAKWLLFHWWRRWEKLPLRGPFRICVWHVTHCNVNEQSQGKLQHLVANLKLYCDCIMSFMIRATSSVALVFDDQVANTLSDMTSTHYFTV